MRCDAEARASNAKQAGRFIEIGALATPLVNMASSTLTLLKPVKPGVSEKQTTRPKADPLPRSTPNNSKKLSSLLCELLARSAAQS